MLQLDNETPFCAALAVLADEAGIDTLFACIKGTFCLHPRVAIAPQQRPIALTDRYRGPAESSSLVEACEHHLGKAGTDVVLQGNAYTPDGKPATRAAVSVAVAERRQVVAVYGDRHWRPGGQVCEPEPFTQMPLHYERALGGRPEHDDRTAQRSALNPVGVGLDRRTGAPLPNLEDPNAPVTGGGERPGPVGFGPIAPHWRPRCTFAGTYDANWARRRAPLLPTDFDRRYFNVAPPGLRFERFLQGAEPVEVIGASRNGPLCFDVPQCGLSVTGCVAGCWYSMPPQLETLAIWPDDGVLTVTWRAKLRCDRRVLHAERVRVEATGIQGVAA